MPLAAHRISPNRARELRERAWALVAQRLGTAAICGRCGATFATQGDRCTADLNERCPGVVAVERATFAAERDVGLT